MISYSKSVAQFLIIAATMFVMSNNVKAQDWVFDPNEEFISLTFFGVTITWTVLNYNPNSDIATFN